MPKPASAMTPAELLGEVSTYVEEIRVCRNLQERDPRYSRRAEMSGHRHYVGYLALHLLCHPETGADQLLALRAAVAPMAGVIDG